MSSPLTILKVGGKIVEEAASLSRLIDNFAHIDGLRLLVHGGGRTATQVAASLGVETQMVDGRRVTSADMLRVVTMVYGGLVNKTIVAQLNARGVSALGLTGADCSAIRSHRRIVRPGDVDYGFVGDVDRVDADTFSLLLDRGIVPVVAPLTLGEDGQLLNTNADTIASSVAKALADRYDITLIFCFEHKGVLRNPADPDSVISHIDSRTYARLKTDGVVGGGMLPKLDNSFTALNAGVKRVIITRADMIGQSCGTVIEL